MVECKNYSRDLKNPELEQLSGRFSPRRGQVGIAACRTIEDVRHHLALVYHCYLTGEPGIKKLSMDINNEPVIPFDPFLLKKSYQAMDDEVLTLRGQKIVIRPYMLQLESLNSRDISIHTEIILGRKPVLLCQRHSRSPGSEV